MTYRLDLDAAEASARCEGPYQPGMARVGEATPQSHPDLFTDAEVLAEVKYLLRLNKRHGSNVLRTMAYAKLLGVLADRTRAH